MAQDDLIACIQAMGWLVRHGIGVVFHLFHFLFLFPLPFHTLLLLHHHLGRPIFLVCWILRGLQYEYWLCVYHRGYSCGAWGVYMWLDVVSE